MTPARTIAVGDIHGCDVALDVLLGALQITAGDCVIILGDVIDRGPNSRRCIERLLDLQQSCRFIHLMGNHEQMLLDSLNAPDTMRAWLGFGGQQTLDSYGGSVDDIPPEHFDFIAAGQEFFESDTDIYVHALVLPDAPLYAQPVFALRWEKLTGRERPHNSGKRVICGHTAQNDGRPLVFEGWVCIDTCAYCSQGALSALDVGTDLLYQADQSGRYWGCVPLADFA